MFKTFLRKKHVAARYGVTERTIDNWVVEQRLPSPVYRGRFPLWREHELDAADRDAFRRAPKPAIQTANS